VAPDYVQFEKDSLQAVEMVSARVFDMVKSKTKIGKGRFKKWLQQAQSGALYLTAEQAVECRAADWVGQ